MNVKVTPQQAAEAAVIKVKKEIPSEEIKEYAESTMNELLGIYGYQDDTNMKSINGDVKHSSKMTPGQREADRSTPESTRSNDDSSKSPLPNRVDEEEGANCDWCHRRMSSNSSLSLGTPEGGRFCSESCFAQSRRATFKRAKTCDWCKHIRHAVNFFEDGVSQLQFCSDKCLNQYKMQIFIKETQAHLDLNPHLKEKGAITENNLITPELWLKNCRSRSVSPNSENGSVSPVVSQKSMDSTSIATPAPSQSIIHRISVAPASKLLSQPPLSDVISRGPSMKTMRKRRIIRNSPPIVDNNPFNGSVLKTNSSNLFNKNPLLLNSDPKLPSNAQFQQNILPPPHMYPIRPPQRLGGLPSNVRIPEYPESSYLGNISNRDQPRNEIPHPVNYPKPLRQPNLNSFQIPPVTVLVPYPIVIPVPVPIPINMPEFLLKLLAQNESRLNGENRSPQENGSDVNNNRELDVSELPLDFTKHKKVINPVQSVDYSKEITESESETDPLKINEDGDTSSNNIPKVKITRLQKKILLSKEADSNRPLRKRKRIVIDSS